MFNARAVVLAVALCLAWAPAPAGAKGLRAALDGLKTDSQGWVSYGGFGNVEHLGARRFQPIAPLRMPGFASFPGYDPIPPAAIGPMPAMRMKAWGAYAPLAPLPPR